MRTYVVSLFFLFISTMIWSQNMDTIYLWPGEVPGETSPKHPAIETDNHSRNVTRLTDVTDPIMVVYTPDSDKFNGLSVVVCPGGGYSILAIDLEGYEIAEWLNKLGYQACVLQYRVPEKQEGALQDVQRALRIARSNLSEDGKLGVLGFSAGGSLSARAATRFNAQSYDSVDGLDKISCRPDFAVLIYPAYLDKGTDRSITPELTITEDTPPMFIFATADDKYGNSALVMAGALRDAKIPVELHLMPEGGHGYGLRSGNIAGETWPLLCEKWLNLID